MCKPSDRSAEPLTVQKVKEFFTSAGSSTPGMYNFFREQSSGAVDLEGSVIGGWYTIPHTYADIATYDRGKRLQVCLDAATAAGFKIPSVNKTVIVELNQADQMQRRTNIWPFIIQHQMLGNGAVEAVELSLGLTITLGFLLPRMRLCTLLENHTQELQAKLLHVIFSVLESLKYY